MIKRYYLLFVLITTIWLSSVGSDLKGVAVRFFNESEKVGKEGVVKFEAIDQFVVPGTGINVFNRDGGGFVIINSESGLSEVVGYSNSGHFELGDKQETILRIFSETNKINKSVPTNVSSIGVPVKGPYLTTQWAQGYPFNKFCPKNIETGLNFPAGCSTVAVAQLFNYYKRPSQSVSNKFQWNLMKDRYDEGCYTEQEADAVATLMADIANELNKVSFYYESPGQWNIWYNGYTMIDVEYADYVDYLNNVNGPQVLKIKYDVEVYFSHAVVMDGIDSNGFWHINWGWGGNCDGWFKPNFFAISYGGMDIEPIMTTDQRFLNPDDNFYIPSMSIRGGVSMIPEQPKAGDLVTVALDDVKFINTDKLGFSFGSIYESSARLFLYEEYPWVSNGVSSSRDYNIGYVGKKYLVPGSDYYYLGDGVDIKRDGSDVSLTFTMPDLPAGKKFILRPEYYLSWKNHFVEIREWPAGSYTMGLDDLWRPFIGFFGSDEKYLIDDANVSANKVPNCFVLTKNEYGNYNVEYSSSGQLMSSGIVGSGCIESVKNDSGSANKYIIGYYGIDGIRHSKPLYGLNLVRYSDGTVEKVFVNHHQ